MIAVRTDQRIVGTRRDAACAAAVPVPFLIYSRGYRQTPIEQLPHLAQFDDFACLPGLVERHATA